MEQPAIKTSCKSQRFFYPKFNAEEMMMFDFTLLLQEWLKMCGHVIFCEKLSASHRPAPM